MLLVGGERGDSEWEGIGWLSGGQLLCPKQRTEPVSTNPFFGSLLVDDDNKGCSGHWNLWARVSIEPR